MNHGPELSIVIPAHNEAPTIAAVITEHAAAALSLGLHSEIVVLDDGSTDATHDIVTALLPTMPGLRLQSHEANLGVGVSLLNLYALAVGTWIYFTPADGQVPASELAPLWAGREGRVLVIGRRRPRRDPLPRRISSSLYGAAMRAVFRVGVHDINSCKLYLTSALREAWPKTTSSFAEGEIIIRLRRQGGRIAEVPIRHLPRTAGRAHGADWIVLSRMLIDFARFALTEGRRAK